MRIVQPIFAGILLGACFKNPFILQLMFGESLIVSVVGALTIVTGMLLAVKIAVGKSRFEEVRRIGIPTNKNDLIVLLKANSQILIMGVFWVISLAIFNV